MYQSDTYSVIQRKLYLLLALSFFVVLSYQNCSEVSFESISFCPKGETCDSMVFKTSSSENYPAFKIFFLIDNSFSMQVMQQRLASSLSSLLDELRDKPFEIHIFSTSQMPGYLSSSPIHPLNITYGPFAYNKQTTKYSYTFNGQNYLRNEPPTAGPISNAKFIFELEPNTVRIGIYPSKNPISSLGANYARFDLNEDGYLDANDYTMSWNANRTFCDSFETCLLFRGTQSVGGLWILFATQLSQLNSTLYLQISADANAENTIYTIDNNLHPNLKRQLMYLIERQIASIGANGADKEMGLCGLARIANSRYLQNGDRAAFIILSNEEDQSQVADCIQKYEAPAFGYTSAVDECRPGETCDSYRLNVALDYNPFIVGKCVVGYQDGTQTPRIEEHGQHISSTVCDPSTFVPRDCNSSELATATNLCRSGNSNNTIQSCKVECRNGLAKPWINPNQYNILLWNVQPNYCDTNVNVYGSDENYLELISNLTSVNINGQDIPRAIKANTCEVKGYKTRFLMGRTSGVLPTTTPAFPANTNFTDNIVSSLDNKIGRSNYFMGAIIHDPSLDSQAGGCEVSSEASSPGTKYKDLVRRVMGRDNSVSICSESYAPIIEDFKRFASTSINREFDISSMAGRTMAAVVLKDVGVSRQLSSSEFEVIDNKLIIAEGILTATSEIMILFIALPPSIN